MAREVTRRGRSIPLSARHSVVWTPSWGEAKIHIFASTVACDRLAGLEILAVFILYKREAPLYQTSALICFPMANTVPIRIEFS